MAHNRLTSLPAPLLTLPRLELLCAAHNAIVALPPLLPPRARAPQPPSLRWLDVGHNKIAELPRSLRALRPTLRALVVAANPLPTHMLAAAADGPARLWAHLDAPPRGAAPPSSMHVVVVGAAADADAGAVSALVFEDPAERRRPSTPRLGAAAAAPIGAGPSIRCFSARLDVPAAAPTAAETAPPPTAHIEVSVWVCADGARSRLGLGAHLATVASAEQSVTLLVGSLDSRGDDARLQAAIAALRPAQPGHRPPRRANGGRRLHAQR